MHKDLALNLNFIDLLSLILSKRDRVIKPKPSNTLVKIFVNLSVNMKRVNWNSGKNLLIFRSDSNFIWYRNSSSHGLFFVYTWKYWNLTVQIPIWFLAMGWYTRNVSEGRLCASWTFRRLSIGCVVSSSSIAGFNVTVLCLRPTFSFQAGCTALPALLNICQVMQARQVTNIWSGKDELPVSFSIPVTSYSIYSS